MASMRARAATVGADLRVIELELQVPEGSEALEDDHGSIGVAAGRSGFGGRPEST